LRDTVWSPKKFREPVEAHTAAPSRPVRPSQLTFIACGYPTRWPTIRTPLILRDTSAILHLDDNWMTTGLTFCAGHVLEHV